MAFTKGWYKMKIAIAGDSAGVLLVDVLALAWRAEKE